MPAVLPPTLEVYYSPTCAPCRLELPSIADFVRERDGKVRVVILDHVAAAREELTVLQGIELRSHDGEDPRAVLRQAGDSDSILPYARTVVNGKTCASWRGFLTRKTAQRLLAAC